MINLLCSCESRVFCGASTISHCLNAQTNFSYQPRDYFTALLIVYICCAICFGKKKEGGHKLKNKREREKKKSKFTGCSIGNILFSTPRLKRPFQSCKTQAMQFLYSASNAWQFEIHREHPFIALGKATAQRNEPLP